MHEYSPPGCSLKRRKFAWRVLPVFFPSILSQQNTTLDSQGLPCQTKWGGIPLVQFQAACQPQTETNSVSSPYMGDDYRALLTPLAFHYRGRLSGFRSGLHTRAWSAQYVPAQYMRTHVISNKTLSRNKCLWFASHQKSIGHLNDMAVGHASRCCG